ncbi:MAG TPA: methyltransferase domain-containing protein [Burkholderiales bacterium]|nr:methyltransferase domain-containing protein [Burkholderiales bacterium]
MHLLRPAAAALAAFLLCLPAAAQKDKDYEPHVGQAGKDVIWVPTPDDVVDRMLRMAQVTPNDYVWDLGAGDGKIAIAAARKFGARALGIEYNPEMAKHAQRNVEKAGVAGRARIVQGDIFVTDFTQATVVTMYLLPALNLKLRPQLLAMRPGTRVVSHSFSMDDWEADETSSLDGRRAYFWVVPANVAGTWMLEVTGGGASEKVEMTLEQRYQKLEGTVSLGAMQGGLREPRLRGFEVAFAYVDNRGVRREFQGRVSGARMEGAFRGDGGIEGRWSATKK